MFEEASSPHGTFKIFVVGALVGAGIALLYAPQSGKETRKLLTKKARLLKEKTQDTVENAQEFIKDCTADVAAVFESGKEAVEQTKHKRS